MLLQLYSLNVYRSDQSPQGRGSATLDSYRHPNQVVPSGLGLVDLHYIMRLPTAPSDTCS